MASQQNNEESDAPVLPVCNFRPVTPCQSSVLRVNPASLSSFTCDDLSKLSTGRMDLPTPRFKYTGGGTTSDVDMKDSRSKTFYVPQSCTKKVESFGTDSGAIKVHSLSSEATVVVPEINRSTCVKNRPGSVKNHLLSQAGDQGHRQWYENNYIRPRTATGLSSSRKLTAGHIIANVAPSCDESSQATSRPGTGKFVEYPASSRPTTGASGHQQIRPQTRTSRTSAKHYKGLFDDREYIMSSQAYEDLQGNEVLQDARKWFQVPDEVYKQWSAINEDGNDKYIFMQKELADKIYERTERRTLMGKNYYKKINYKILFGHFVELINDFALLPVPPGFTIRCHIKRCKTGVEGRLNPTYYLYLQRQDEDPVLVMAARRSKSLMETRYLIGTNPGDLTAKSCLGVLHSNFKGNEYILHSSKEQGFNPVSEDNPYQHDTCTWKTKKYGHHMGRLLEICYASSALGYKGPRKISLTIPKLRSDVQRVTFDDTTPEEDVEDLLMTLNNKMPIWNPDNQSFVLNFQGRVQVASVKNFQIIHPEMNSLNHSLLQFGRSDKHSFILDFSYPFCPLQAFAIGLSSFEVKWGLE